MWHGGATKIREPSNSEIKIREIKSPKRKTPSLWHGGATYNRKVRARREGRLGDDSHVSVGVTLIESDRPTSDPLLSILVGRLGWFGSSGVARTAILTLPCHPIFCGPAVWSWRVVRLHAAAIFFFYLFITIDSDLR